MGADFRATLFHVLAILGFASLFYTNSFANFFVWNDWTLIIENFLIKDWRNLPEICTAAFWKPLIGEAAQIYRPITLVSFMPDYAVWGLKPAGYHLTNISLHVLNSLLVYFLMRVYVVPMTALIGSVLFAAHPIHTAAVTYISGRAELLMSFFLLSGTILFLQSEKRKSVLLYVSSLPLFFLALLAKETAVFYLPLLIAADATAYPSSWQSETVRRLMRFVGPLAALGVYLFLRTALVTMNISDYGLAGGNFFLVLKAISLCLGLLLFPWNLHFLHRVEPQIDLQLWLSLLLVVVAGLGLFLAIRSGNQVVIFSVLWFLFGLMSLFQLIGLDSTLLEGWLYFPSIGFFLLAALGLSRLVRWLTSRIHIWLTLLIGVLLGGATFYRNQDWKDEIRISLHTAAASPHDPVALRVSGNAHFRRARVAEAEQLFQKAALLARDDPRLHESLGRLYSFTGKESEALSHYQRMKELAPREPYPYWSMGRYYLRGRSFDEAERYLREAVRLFPYSSELYIDLVSIHYQQGRLDAALTELETALKIFPHSPALKRNLVQLSRKKG